MIRLGEIYIGLGRRGQNVFGHLVRFSRLRKIIFFQIYIQIDLKLHNSTAAVEDFIHETSWFRGKS